MPVRHRADTNPCSRCDAYASAGAWRKLPAGELPPLGSFPNERGIDSGIDNGETRTYCFTLTADTTSIDFNASDLTGAAQCFWATAFTVTPPLGSGLFPDTDFGRNPHLGYFRSGQLIRRERTSSRSPLRGKRAARSAID
jgi:hypothetical protein